MCGRYALFSPGQEIARWFGVEALSLSPRYNIAPGQMVYAVHRDRSGERCAGVFRWGFIPHWATGPQQGKRLINARAETVNEKAVFRAAYKRRRCILPANGFYEWKTSKGVKQPWYIECKTAPFLAFAGIWERWVDRQSGESIESCAILTREAEGIVRQIHHRMPLLIDPDRFDSWLDPASEDPPDLTECSWTAQLDARPVSRAVNSPANDVPGCLDADNGLGMTDQLL